MRHDQAFPSVTPPPVAEQPSSSADEMAAETSPKGMPYAHLLTALVTLLCIDNLLLFRFLGTRWDIMAAAGLAASAAIAAFHRLGLRHRERIPASRLLVCLCAAVIVLMLGGEGRLFYANLDWFIRDAVLDDMIRWPWPFAYAGHGAPLLLRAPLGMYLLPAIAGKIGGQGAADAALLGQNSLVLAIILALGSLMFATPRARRIALVVVLLFSGLDTVGEFLVNPDRLLPLSAHINDWAGIQYTAQLTQAFWVPQHAMCGWLGAVLFMLWRDERIGLAVFLGVVPLMLLWSPLGVMGTLPFAALAGIESLLRRRVMLVDIGLPLLALAVAIIPALYLQTDAGRVGIHLEALPPALYILFEMLEAVPFLAAVWFGSRVFRFGTATYALVVACLLGFPFVVVGASVDFVMRVSIPALAILSVMVADLLAGRASNGPRAFLIVVLTIGALNPARELYRAIRFAPVPTASCDLWTEWDRVFPDFGKQTYFAPVAALPGALHPSPKAFAAPPFAAPTSSRSCGLDRWRRVRF